MIERKPVNLGERKKPTFVGGSTVAQRIYNYCRNSKNPPYISLETKQAIGEIVKDKFFNTPDKKNKGAYKKQVKEKEGVFNVLVYPQYFIPVIDAIIFSYFKGTKNAKSGKG